jgi:hypothetical protein
VSKFILISAALFTGALGLNRNSHTNDFLLQHSNVQLKHKIPNDSFPFKINAIAPYIDYFNDGQYFFNKWVKGSVVSSNNIEIANDTYFFNYDKISNNLLITTDLKQIIEIDKREFKSFALKDGSNEYRFEHNLVIDNKKFFQVLVRNDKYSLYKWTLTKLRKKETYNASFWELVDAHFYYVVFPNARFYKKISLKKKSIEKNLATEPEKIDAYFSLHPYNEIDEALLIDLINYLNK